MKSISTKTVDAVLFFYGGLVTLFFTISAINNLSSTFDLASFALFLPVTVYFTVEAAKLGYRSLHRFLNPGYFANPKTTDWYFSLRTFFNQEDRLFLINLLLLTLAFCLVLLRLSLTILNS